MNIQIKTILKAKKIDIKTISSDLSIPYITFSNYVRNIRQPDIDTLFKISNYLEISIEELYGMEKPSKEKEIISKIKELIGE